MRTGEIKDGSCVCVDHILALNEVHSIQDLTKLSGFNFDAAIPNSKLYIKVATDSLPQEIVKSARVGLNMKKKEDIQTLFVMKLYRYLILPSVTKKGKIHMALALHSQGKMPRQIQEIVGSTLVAINGWIELYKKGYNMKITDFLNVNLSDNEQLCKAIGSWTKTYGSKAQKNDDASALQVRYIINKQSLTNKNFF